MLKIIATLLLQACTNSSYYYLSKELEIGTPRTDVIKMLGEPTDLHEPVSNAYGDIIVVYE